MLAACRREAPTLVRIAIPLVLAQMAQNGMSLIDTLMAGRLGPEALAGIALGGVLYFSVTVSIGAVLFAVGPVTAQAIGAGKQGDAARAARHGLLIGAVISVPVMVLLWSIGPLLPRLGQDPATAAAATGYLRAVLWGVPAYMVFVALRGALEGRGHTRPIMVVAFAAVGLNVLANNAFMFGRWGFPDLGLTGAGVATSIVYTAMAITLAGIVARGYRTHPIFMLEPYSLRLVGELIRLGVPIALTVGFEIGLFTMTALLMGLFGQAALGAHQIAIQSASFTFMIPLGLGIATTVCVGQAVGRGDAMGTRAAGLVGMGLATAVMTLTALLYWTAPRAVVGLYLDLADPVNAAVIASATTFLRVAAVFQLVDGLQVAAIGALRGLKDTRVPMIITFVSYWGIGLTSGALLAFAAGLGGVGLWIGLVLGLGVAAVWLTTRYWLLVRTRPEARALP